MSKDEIKMLLKQIKIMYPRFESVVKEGMTYAISPEVTEAWWNRIGWMDYDRAITILDRYMESEAGSRVPTIALWMNNGKAQQRAENYVSAFFDRRRGICVWTPEPDGPSYERPLNFNTRVGCYEDADGYLWIVPEG